MRVLEEAWKLDQGNAELAFFLGRDAGSTTGEAGKAAAALQARPREGAAALRGARLLGRPRERRRPHRSARSSYLKRALAVRPDAFLPSFALGAIHALRGASSRKAEAFLKKAVTDRRERRRPSRSSGTIAYERGRLTEAIDALQRAVRLDPDDEDGALPARPLLPRPRAGRRRRPSGSRRRSS